MSKIGKKPIIVPSSVKIELKGEEIKISGQLGEITFKIPNGLKIKSIGSQLLLTRLTEERQTRMLHGTFRQLFFNAIKGVTEGWEKQLEVRGIGFRANLEGENLVLSLGFSHPVKLVPPEGIKFEVKENKITVTGVDKAKVGLQADKLRRIYPPDSYKGKGIRYAGEEIILKPGKTAKVGAGVAPGGTKQ